MSGMADGVSKYFIVYHDGGSMHFDGFKTLNDLALQALFNESWRPGWDERIVKFKADLDARIERDNHEHEWVDSVDGPDMVGKHCATCGEEKDYGDDD